MTVAIYARVSTDDQSCELQVERLRAWCAAMKLGEPVVFPDDGVSGIRDNRPQLDELRRRMKLGEFSVVAVTKLDRIGRSVQMILRFWDDAEASQTRVVLIDQGIDTSTPAGRLQRTMLAAVAEFERELILERTQAGIQKARNLGKKFGRPRTVTEAQAAEVRVRKAQGESFRHIAMSMGLKLGAVRSALRRDQTPPSETESEREVEPRVA